MNRKKTGLALAVAMMSWLGASRAHAGQCADPDITEKWTIKGSPALFPGAQMSIELSALNLARKCVDAGTETCTGGDENVCSSSEGVAEIWTASVGELVPHFIGPPSMSFTPDVNASEGGDNWQYADTSVEGSSTRAWFRHVAPGSLQVVFEMWQGGSHYQSALLSFIPKSNSQFAPGLGVH
jgi:hypothetical protein